MAYSGSLEESYRKAATYVDKILKGAKPADLPIEQPTRFELVINLRTARELKLTIPQSLRARADQTRSSSDGRLPKCRSAYSKPSGAIVV